MKLDKKNEFVLLCDLDHCPKILDNVKVISRAVGEWAVLNYTLGETS